MAYNIKLVLFLSIVSLYIDFSTGIRCTSNHYLYGLHYKYCSTSCCGYLNNRYCCTAYLGWAIGSIIGAVIGGIVGLVLLCVLIACICAQCNKGTRHGAVVQPNNGGNITMISQQQQQQQQQPAMYPGMAYPSAYPPPSYPPQPQPQFYGGHPQPMAAPPPYGEGSTPGQAPFPTKQ